MLPLNTDFLPVPTSKHVNLKRLYQQVTPVAIAISAITKVARDEFRLTMASAPPTNQWEPNMDIMLRDNTNANIYKKKIVRIDTTNNYIYIKDENEILDKNTLIDNGIPYGVINFTQDTHDAYIIKNNHGEGLFFRYGGGARSGGTTDYFYYTTSNELTATIIQIVNVDDLDHIHTITIEWSADGLNWLPFAVPVTAGPITAGASWGVMLNYQTNGIRLRITVDNTDDAYYYLIAR